MAAKKAKPSSAKQLRATVKRLEAKFKRADAKATRWKKKAKQYEAAAASSSARASKLEAKLAKARRPTGQSHASPGVEVPAVVPSESAISTVQPTNTPNDSWTVVELRAEARSRGLTGLSRKSKAELIAALT